MPAWFFGNASESRMNGSSRSAISSRSMPEAIPPCGGAPIAERVEQEAELRPLLLGRDVQQAEHLRLELGLVDPERAAGELDPVADQVVGDRLRRAGIGVEQRLRLLRSAA